MNFEQLKRRVERAEFLVDARTRQTHASWDAVRRHWREAWTPARIVVAGLVSGFVVGRAQPARAMNRLAAVAGPQTLQLVSSIAGLLASLQATFAAVTAKGAADTADDAAQSAEQVAETTNAAVDAGIGQTHAPDAPDDGLAAAHAADALPPSQRRRRPDPSWDAVPRPAEAATDVSEQR